MSLADEAAALRAANALRATVEQAEKDAAWAAERAEQDALGAEFVEWLVANDIPPVDLWRMWDGGDYEYPTTDFSKEPIGKAWDFWLHGSAHLAVTTEGMFISLDSGPIQRLAVYELARFSLNRSGLGMSDLRSALVQYMAAHS